MVCLHPLNPVLYPTLRAIRKAFTILSIVFSIISTVIIISCMQQSSKNYSALLLLIIVSIDV